MEEPAAASGRRAVRPASARQLRPPSARSMQGGQESGNLLGTYVTFYGQAVYAGDSKAGNASQPGGTSNDQISYLYMNTTFARLNI